MRKRTRLWHAGLLAILGVFAIALAVGCTDDQASATPADGDRREVEAPVESIDLLILESAPPQYNVEIVSALPNGCQMFERYEIERNGTDIRITVWNTIPAADDVACTQVYGTHTGTASLGSDFDSGTEYTLTVGDQTETFVAQ